MQFLVNKINCCFKKNGRFGMSRNCSVSLPKIHCLVPGHIVRRTGLAEIYRLETLIKYLFAYLLKTFLTTAHWALRAFFYFNCWIIGRNKYRATQKVSAFWQPHHIWSGYCTGHRMGDAFWNKPTVDGKGEGGAQVKICWLTLNWVLHALSTKHFISIAWNQILSENNVSRWTTLHVLLVEDCRERN